MAAEKHETALVDAAALGSAFAQAVAALAPKPELREGDPEYVARQRAEGWFDDFFGKRVFQNGKEAQARGLSEQTRKRTSELKPGKYLSGRVTVEIHQNGDAIFLLYPTSGDNMMINQTKWTSFQHLIDQIWDEMHVPA